MFNFSVLPPLSLYIHYPWCVKKCPYCDFNSHEQKAQQDMAYVNALIRDLEQELPDIWGRSIHSVFIGGGTPSLISPEALDELFVQLRALLNLTPDIEVTLEANPGTMDADKFTEFRAIGINRLSIGVQSFQDDLLQRIGRIHGRKEAIRAAEIAHDAGFDNFNLDLMYALPQQSLKQALDDVETAIALEPTHLSHYQLTLEPNTYFAKYPPQLPDDDIAWEMLDKAQERLFAKGFGRYEVSAYAKQGKYCRHNLNYWKFGDYLGIGAGAHGKISDAARQTITRRFKCKQPAEYMEKAATGERIGGEHQLSRKDAAFEFMLNATRLVQGFTPQEFLEHTGMPISMVESGLQQAEEQGLMEWDIHRIRPSQKGLQYLNNLQTLFLPDEVVEDSEE